MNRTLKIVAIVIVVLVVIVVAIPFFIDANAFRPKLESDLTDALGRPVKVGNLSLSLLSGAVKADDISIADDPAFSQTAFVQAKSLSVGVEIIPLIFSKSLNVTEITLNQPEISLMRSPDGERWNFSSLGSASSAKKTEPAAGGATSISPSLSVAKLAVSDGQLTISRARSPEKPRVYDKVDITVTNFSFATSFPLTMTANLPAGGTLKLDGTVGPIDANDAALTPLQVKVRVHQMNLAASGFIDPASGISGIADFDGKISSDGHEAKTDGRLNVEKLQVAQKGAPAGKPVRVEYSVTYDLAKQSGTLTRGEIALGKAVAQLTGTYDAHGTPTSINMKLEGPSMLVDDLEAMLPAVGVTLPPKSELKGGTVAINFKIVGPVDKLVTTGTVRLENSTLAGFSLGSNLSAVSGLGGKGEGERDTVIQNFSSNVRVALDGTRADDINLTIPTLGTLTGAGTVSPSNALDFKMKADNIPFLVQGTTSDPKFVPDVKGMAGSLLNNALGTGKNGKNNPLGALGGLLKK